MPCPYACLVPTTHALSLRMPCPYTEQPEIVPNQSQSTAQHEIPV